MEKVDLNKLRTFYYVAMEGSYQKASLYLGIKPSYISKQITSLEDSFKCKLFKRSHRSLVLTKEGSDFLRSTQVIIDQVRLMGEVLNPDRKEDDDIIRLVTTTGVTSLWLVKQLENFAKQYPNYRLRIITSDEKINISNHYADIAVLPKVDPDPDIHYRKLFTFHSKLFASKKYLEKYGVPQTVSDLDQHRLISFYHNEAGHRGNVDWHLLIDTKNKPRIPYLVINSAIGQYEAALQGLGILAISEEFPYLKANSLLPVLPNEGVEIPVYLATQIQKMYLNKVLAIDTFFKKKQLSTVKSLRKA